MKFARFVKAYVELIIFLFLKLVLPKNTRQPNTLLLINTGEIGDLIVSSILLENPKVFEKYKKVDFLIKAKYLELFSNYSGKVNFYGYNYKKYKKSIFYKYSLLSKLRKNGYEKCIHLTAARGILNEEITHLLGAGETYALNSYREYLGGALGKFLDKKYNLIIAKDVLNEYEKHIELINFLGVFKNIAFNNGIAFNESKNNLLITSFGDITNTIIIAPFSSLRNRDWETENFVELVENLNDKYNMILIGSSEQKEDLDYIKKNNSRVKILSGELKLNEIPFLLKNAKLFIGLDSGITHVALKVGIPLIAIIGGGEFGRFFPYRESSQVKYLYYKMDCYLCHWECSKDEMYCMKNVTPAQVITEIDKIFNDKL